MPNILSNKASIRNKEREARGCFRTLIWPRHNCLELRLDFKAKQRQKTPLKLFQEEESGLNLTHKPASVQRRCRSHREQRPVLTALGKTEKQQSQQTLQIQGLFQT